MLVPGVDELVRELSARLNKKRARSHRGVTDPEREEVLRLRPRTELFEDWSQRRRDDWLGERPRRVVGARAPSFFAGLQIHRTRWDHGGRPRRHELVERMHELIDGLRGLHFFRNGL